LHAFTAQDGAEEEKGEEEEEDGGWRVGGKEREVEGCVVTHPC